MVALTGLLAPATVARAIGAGTDVYLFLSGMMVLAEIARREGVFDWVALHAVRASGGSRRRLLGLVYGVGIIVTTVLSNDATAVVLTPAVAAAVRAAKVEPRAYLFACALIANAASFVLPISNPANLVVFAQGLPSLGAWVASFALPSLCSIGVTYAVIMLVFRSDLAGGVEAVEPTTLSLPGRVTVIGIAATAVALVTASTFGVNLGAVTLAGGAIVLGIVAGIDRRAAIPILRSVSWAVLPLVAGLFVLVSAVEATGLLHWTTAAARFALHRSPPVSVALAAFGTGITSNVVNNLPAGLIAGTTIATLHASDAFRGAVAIGIDLGPNLSVTGSLATVLWLLALRRENIDVDAWMFARVGLLAMPTALLAAAESLLLTLH